MTAHPLLRRPPNRLGRLGGDPAGLLWWTCIVGLVLLIILGCSGLLVSLAFQQYSSTKWLFTVLAPATVLLLFTAKRPVTILAAATVVLLPFTPVAFKFRGFPVFLIAVVVVTSVSVAFLSTSRTGGPTAVGSVNRVGRAAVLVVMLLLPAAVRGLDPGLWFVQLAAVAGTGYVISRACRLDPRGAPFVMAAFAGSIGLQSLLAVREFQTGQPFSAYGAAAPYGSHYFFGFEGVFRPSGSFYDPISLGNVLSLACPMLVVMACHRGFPVLLRLWFASCCLCAAGALVLTLSRMSWVGAASGVVVVVLLTPGVDRLRQVVFLAVGTFIVAITAVALAGPSLLPRFNSIFHPTGAGVVTAGGDETRQLLWRASFEVFSAHPFFGVGTGNLHAFLVQTVGGAGLFGHAHSTYLQNLAEGGLLGGLAIGVLAYVSFSEIALRLRMSRFQDLYAQASAGAIVALAVAWTTDFTIRYTAVLTCMALPFIFLMATRLDVAPEPDGADQPVRERPARSRAVLGSV